MLAGILIALAVMGALAGLYKLGRSHGRKAEVQLNEKRLTVVKEEITKVDTAAEAVTVQEITKHAEEAKTRLDQGAGWVPFDKAAAAQMLAEAGVDVRVRGHKTSPAPKQWDFRAPEVKR